MQNPTPGLPEFEYVKPASLAEASAFLLEHAEDARPFLGGTDTFVRMRDGVWHDQYLVDVKHLDGMGDIEFDPATGLTLGAAVTMNQVIASTAVQTHYPVLAEAARTVASWQLRSRATVVGNLCNASPAGDTTGACIVLGGELLVYGRGGLRTEALAGFFRGPGQTALGPGDIVTALRLPLPPPGSVGRYRKLGRNAQGDLAIVGVTALGHPDGDTLSGFRFRLALASVAAVPLVPERAEQILAEQPVTPSAIEAAAVAAMEAATPIDDTRGSARYRTLMVRNVTREVLTAVWARMGE